MDISFSSHAAQCSSLISSHLHFIGTFRTLIFTSARQPKLTQLRQKSSLLPRRFSSRTAHSSLCSTQHHHDRIIIHSSNKFVRPVHLVGAGPGSADLLTLRAVRILSLAEVVVYDRLGTSDVLSQVSSEALLIPVGKGRGLRTGSQEEIQRTLVHHARLGRRVVRLKGGDPLIFGRIADELRYLQEREIPFEIVPGISAGNGICAALGIPLTAHGVSKSVHFITAHEFDKYQEECVVDVKGTYVVYMGLKEIEKLCKRLLAGGLSRNVAAVAVQSGTTESERVAWSNLAELPECVRSAQFGSPTILVIGDVVRMALGWQHWNAEQQRNRAMAREVENDERLGKG